MPFNTSNVDNGLLNTYSRCQSDFPKMASGGVRIILTSLYPIEQGFMNLFGSDGTIADAGICVYTGFPKYRVDDIQSNEHNYFDDLMSEIDMLMKNQMKLAPSVDTSRKYAYKIVNNIHEATHFINSSQGDNVHIAVIISIEGAHSLFNLPVENYMQLYKDGSANDLKHPDTSKLLDDIKLNINILKSNRYGARVFSITFAHHFYNMLCGQSISFTDLINHVFDQGEYGKQGFTELGKQVLKEVNESGILIDTKHMSVPSRIWLYSQEKYKDVPFISSHTGVNGYKTMESSMEMNATHHEAHEKYNNSNIFNPWDINISDEEIVEIARRGGLIGISLEQRIITGRKELMKIRLMSLIPFFGKHMWCKPIYNNIVHIATVLKDNGIDKADIWKNISIGSDFDGMINPVNSVNNALKYGDMEKSLVALLYKHRNKEHVLNGLTIDDMKRIARDICYNNTISFLERTFI
jgi:microsomal dipeptidase-like Zn-dependent dipeptidase